jgi:hypothetical protein
LLVKGAQVQTEGKAELFILLTMVIALAFIFKAHAIGSLIAHPGKIENI